MFNLNDILSIKLKFCVEIRKYVIFPFLCCCSCLDEYLFFYWRFKRHSDGRTLSNLIVKNATKWIFEKHNDFVTASSRCLKTDHRQTTRFVTRLLAFQSKTNLQVHFALFLLFWGKRPWYYLSYQLIFCSQLSLIFRHGSIFNWHFTSQRASQWWRFPYKSSFVLRHQWSTLCMPVAIRNSMQLAMMIISDSIHHSSND